MFLLRLSLQCHVYLDKCMCSLRHCACAVQTLLAPVPPAAFSSTATVGEFASAINSAEPSPDGRWLCVLCDAEAGGNMQVWNAFLFERIVVFFLKAQGRILGIHSNVFDIYLVFACVRGRSNWTFRSMPPACSRG